MSFLWSVDVVPLEFLWSVDVVPLNVVSLRRSEMFIDRNIAQCRLR